MNFLQLSYSPEDQWQGELTAYVECEGFSGRSSAWFSRLQIEAFLSHLEPCPIPDDNVPTLAGGVFSVGQLADEHVGVRIVSHDATGKLRVCVHLAIREHSTGKLDQDLSAAFVTDYADIDRFKVSLAELMEGTTAKAVLEGRQ